MPPRTTAPGAPTSTSRRVMTIGPAWLIRQQRVVALEMEPGADDEHQAHRLDGPPAVLDQSKRAGRDDDRQQCRKPRLEAPSQRVRHALTLRRNAWPA